MLLAGVEALFISSDAGRRGGRVWDSDERPGTAGRPRSLSVTRAREGSQVVGPNSRDELAQRASESVWI